MTTILVRFCILSVFSMPTVTDVKIIRIRQYNNNNDNIRFYSPWTLLHISRATFERMKKDTIVIFMQEEAGTRAQSKTILTIQKKNQTKSHETIAYSRIRCNILLLVMTHTFVSKGLCSLSGFCHDDCRVLTGSKSRRISFIYQNIVIQKYTEIKERFSNFSFIRILFCSDFFLFVYCFIHIYLCLYIYHVLWFCHSFHYYILTFIITPITI